MSYTLLLSVMLIVPPCFVLLVKVLQQLLIRNANRCEMYPFKWVWHDPVCIPDHESRQSLRFSPASVYFSPTFSSSSLGLGGGHTACRRPGVRSSLSVGDTTSVCGETTKHITVYTGNVMTQQFVS